MVLEKENGEAAGMAGVSFGAAGGAEDAEAKEKGDVVADVPNPEKPPNLLGGAGYVVLWAKESRQRCMLGRTSAVVVLGARTLAAFDATPARLGKPFILFLGLNTSHKSL